MSKSRQGEPQGVLADDAVTRPATRDELARFEAAERARGQRPPQPLSRGDRRRLADDVAAAKRDARAHR